MNETDLKKKLSKEQYHILREKGTEPAFTGKYWNHKEKGRYVCQACGAQLFSSDTKFETKIPGLAGWPSFDKTLPSAIKLERDSSYGMNRTEVLCAKCGSHLGHVFDDNTETTTGKHFCINSACLAFQKK